MAPPPKRRPVIRILLLLILGCGLYFGFEPLASLWSEWTKSPKATISNKTPGTRSQNKTSDQAKASHSSSPANQSESTAASTSGVDVDSGFTLKPNQDSTKWIFDCHGNQESCLARVQEKRGNLASWIGKIVAQIRDRNEFKFGTVHPTEAQWEAIWKSEMDSGLPEPGLASLVKLTVRTPNFTQVYSPVHHESGWDLCPQKGCAQPLPLLNPVSKATSVEVDLELQVLRAVGPTQIVAPDPGWIATIDEVEGKIQIAVDHPGMNRTVVLGTLKPSGNVKPGQFIGRGKPLASSLQDSGWVQITYVQMGSPELPKAWKEWHGP